MRSLPLVGILFLLSATNSLFSQDTTSADVSAVKKPSSFDSTKTLEEQYKQEDQKRFIGLKLYLPPVANPEVGPILYSNENDSTIIKGNKYFTVIDVLNGDSLNLLKQYAPTNICGNRYNNIDSFKQNDLIIFAIFILRDDSKNDTLEKHPVLWVVSQSKRKPYCCSNFNSFIAVPYFEKQKQMFQDQEVIELSDKSIWTCKKVSILKTLDNDSQDSIYDVYCVLENSKGEQVRQRPPSEKLGRSFITKKEYEWLDHADRTEKEEFFRTEKEKKENYRADCINKFGTEYGKLIALSEIAAGMSREMCKASWGEPWNIIRTTYGAGIKKEVWFYSWNYRLYFKDGILVFIQTHD